MSSPAPQPAASPGCRVRWAGVLILLLAGNAAQAQLRVVTYNTLGAPRSPHTEIILRSIGEETRNGFAKPIDILLLQEQNGPSGDTQAFVNLLNSMYGAGSYARGTVSGGPAGSFIRQTIVYRTQSVDLLGELAFGTTGGSNQERQALRYLLRPDGYSSTADFYAYNSHYKASLDMDPPGPNAAQRNAEATTIRANSDALGEGTHAIYAGDHNFYYSDSREPAWATLTGGGPGQANDPANRVGNWHNSSSLADVHSQAPCSGGCPSGFATGGLDDRFDFQLVTGEFLDGEGLSYIAGSYHSFGNNGSLPCCNSDINDSGNTVTFPGVTTYSKTQILDALWNASDHLPVVADYQLPAVLNAIAGAAPPTLNVGDTFNLDVSVHNAANVLQPIGADELDYSVTTAGNLLGSYFDQVDMALGGVNVHQIQLDTSTPGMKSGTIFVQSASQAVQNPMIQIPISFEVLDPVLDGDFNGDGRVDAGDYVRWRNHLGDPDESGINFAGDGDDVSLDDYALWKASYGDPPGGGGLAGGPVPEPSSWWLLVIGFCLGGRRFGTLGAWTRRK